MKIDHASRFVIGTVSLFLAFILITTGGGVTWGLTGALYSAGIALAIMGVGFIATSQEP